MLMGELTKSFGLAKGSGIDSDRNCLNAKYQFENYGKFFIL